jgi:hypothetical protein
VLREEVERAFADAGWQVGGGFFESRMSVVGLRSGLMIIAYESELKSETPLFELVDFERCLTYWVRVVPTPGIAAKLLWEQGGLPAEERGNPHIGDTQGVGSQRVEGLRPY